MSPRILGWYHIIGATAGLGAVLWAWGNDGILPGGSLVFALIPFAVCASAGGYLIRGDTRGFPLAIISQILQIPIIILPDLTWKFIAGAIASVTESVNAGLYFYAGIEGTWLINWHALDHTMRATVGINFAPVIVLALLVRSRRSLGHGSDASAAPAV